MTSIIFISCILCSVINLAQGSEMILNACKAHWLNVKCERDDLLMGVKMSLKVGTAEAGPCYGYVHDPLSEIVPNEMREDCGSSGSCAWKPMGCEGKQDGCTIYVRPDRLGEIVTNSEIQLLYECKMGNQRVTWIVIVCIVGAAFFLMAIVIAIIVWLKGRSSEDYDKFDDEASRSGSMRRGEQPMDATSPVRFSAGEGKVNLGAE